MPRFPVVLRGYDCAQVDALAARIEDALHRGVGFLTADDVLRSRFAVVLRGYDQGAVDEYLYACIRELQNRAPGRPRPSSHPEPAPCSAQPEGGTRLVRRPRRLERAEQGPERPQARRHFERVELAGAAQPPERPQAPGPLERPQPADLRECAERRPEAAWRPQNPEPARGRGRSREHTDRLAEWIRNVRFSVAGTYPGYDDRQVNAFLDQVAAGLGGAAPPVTALDVRAVVFRTVEPGRGYNQYEVDRFLAGLAEALESSLTL